jgi:uncharacterized lipoprotein YmbA
MKRKSILITAVLFPFFLVGCASTHPTVPTYQVPANLTAPCEELPRMRGDTLGDLYKYTVEVVTLYNQCAMRHDALSQAVKK